MEKKSLKEKALYAFIRERTKQLKERPRHEVDVPGPSDAREQEEENSAVDQVQGAAKYAAYQTLTHAERLRRRNASHRETYFATPKRSLP